MKTKTINREDIKDKDYRLILNTENHHNHEIIEDEHGTLRWKPKPLVNKLISKINLNDVWILFEALGYDKNSEIIRQLYRDMGYSLYGYWEVFYWNVNNEIADEYVPNRAGLGNNRKQ